MPAPATPTPGSSPSQVRKLYRNLSLGHKRAQVPQLPTQAVTSFHLASSLLPPHLNPTLPEGNRLSTLQAPPREVEEVQVGKGHWPFSHLNRNSQMCQPPTNTYPNTDAQPVSSSHHWCSRLSQPSHHPSVLHPALQPTPTQQDSISTFISMPLPSATQPYPQT